MVARFRNKPPRFNSELLSHRNKLPNLHHSYFWHRIVYHRITKVPKAFKTVEHNYFSPLDYETSKAYFHCALRWRVPAITIGVERQLWYSVAIVSKVNIWVLMYSDNDWRFRTVTVSKVRAFTSVARNNCSSPDLRTFDYMGFLYRRWYYRWIKSRSK